MSRSPRLIFKILGQQVFNDRYLRLTANVFLNVREYLKTNDFRKFLGKLLLKFCPNFLYLVNFF